MDWKNVLLTTIVAGGMAALTAPAQAQQYDSQAQGYSQGTIRSVQRELRHSGYYRGPLDGIDGPATRAAIRKYQNDQNLTVNGRLDRETRASLGFGPSGAANRSDDERVEHRERRGSAARSEEGAEATPTETGSMAASSSAAVSAAQRSLKQKGFYKGNVDGEMGPETHSAIREFQKNTNLNVTGRLDEATLSKLGVSK